MLANYPNLSANNTRGNFKGKLAHNGERLVLSFPDTITSTNSTGLVTTNTIHIPVDEVNYGIGGRWGQWADGGGSSLELLDPRSNHRLAANWADSDESTKSSWVTIQNTGLLDLGHPSVPAADELQLFLQGPGEALIDDIQSFVPAGPNRVTNSTFEAGISGWVFQGTQRPSSWQNSGGYNSSGALHVRATERGNQAADRIRTYLNPAFSPGQTATIQAKARWLRGSPDVLFRFRGGFLEATGRLAVPFNLVPPGLVTAPRGPMLDQRFMTSHTARSCLRPTSLSALWPEPKLRMESNLSFAITDAIPQPIFLLFQCWMMDRTEMPLPVTASIRP